MPKPPGHRPKPKAIAMDLKSVIRERRERIPHLITSVKATTAMTPRAARLTARATVIPARVMTKKVVLKTPKTIIKDRAMTREPARFASGICLLRKNRLNDNLHRLPIRIIRACATGAKAKDARAQAKALKIADLISPEGNGINARMSETGVKTDAIKKKISKTDVKTGATGVKMSRTSVKTDATSARMLKTA